MLKSVSLAVECAVELCAAICAGDSDTLAENTFDFVKKKGLTNITLENIEDEFNDNLPARLFSDYKTNPQKINNKAMIRGLLRKLWLRHMIVSNSEGTTIAEIQNIVSQKFQEEKHFDPDLTPSGFRLFNMLDRRLQTNIVLEDAKKMYSAMSDEFSNAYQVVAAAFSSLNQFGYMIDLYKVEARSSGSTPDGSALLSTASAAPAFSQEPVSEPAEDTLPSDPEQTLRNMNRLLEKEVYDLGVKLSYAKKDAVRDFITALTDCGFGAPLSELYRIYKAPDTPEHIKGVINNLFMALRSQNIRLFREREVGSAIVLSEENQAGYAPYQNEEIFLSDEAVVYYPGYRFDRETMVRPTVRKKNTEVE